MKFTFKNNLVPFREIPVGEFFRLPDSKDIYLKIAHHNSERCCVFNTTTNERSNLYNGKDVVPLRTEIVIYQ